MTWKTDGLALVPALTLGVVFLALLSLGVNREIQRVQVDGDLDAADRAEVTALVKAHLDGGILSADIRDLAEQLRGLSWPSSIAVRRVWPDRIVVSVRKSTPIARWGDEHYLTSAGEIVSLASPREDLPALACAHADPHAAMEMYRALAATAAPLRLGISRLEQNLLGEWIVGFDNGVSLSLGASQVAERMNRFAYAYARTLHAHMGAIAHVDARYTGGLAVRFNELIAGNSLDAVGQ